MARWQPKRRTAKALRQEEFTPRASEDADAYGNETRILGGTKAAFQRPWHKDTRWWIRWPAQMWRVTGQRFVPRGQRSEFRPPAYWWSRWLGYVWRIFQRSGGYDVLLRPLLQSYLNVLLVFLPLALAAVVTPLAPEVVLISNFLAIIPLSGLVLLASDHLSASINPTLGKLLVTYSDNIVELVVGAVALCKGELRLAQLSIIGSVLSYSLLIIGSCFIVHGIRYREGKFNSFAIRTVTSLNLIALSCLLIPSTFQTPVEASWDRNSAANLVLNHGIALILLLLHILFNFFSLRTHDYYFDRESLGHGEDNSAYAAGWSLGPVAAIIWLVVTLTCVTLCTLALVSSIQISTWKGNISLLGFLLFPFLGNVADYLSAIEVAWKDDLDTTISVTIGSSMQLLLFTLPMLVTLGWITGKPLTFHLDIFESVIVFFGVLVVKYLVSEGKSTYMDGAICIALYVIIALATFLSYRSAIPI